MAADGLGHLAPAPLRAGRRGRAAGRAGAVPVDGRPSGAPRLRHRDRLPPGKLICLPEPGDQLQHGLRPNHVHDRDPPARGARADRGVRRRACTLGVGRPRWTLAKLMPLAIIVAAATALFSLVFFWYYQPFFADGSTIPLDPRLFDLHGVAFAAWTLAAFAIGALMGLLIRRVAPAIAATLAAAAGLLFVARLYLQ